jgi:fructoselysine-6-P-deglycase FrlB-like protein
MRFTTFEAAMTSQPEVLQRLDERLDAQLQSFPSGVARWRAGDTVALLGMGAAHHSTHALATELRSAGIRALDVPASELRGADAASLADHALVVSESGRSPEPIDVARRFPAGRRLVISNDPEAAIAEVADAAIDLGGFADSRAYTVGFTAILLAYDRLIGSLGVGRSDARSLVPTVAECLDASAAPAERHGAVLAGASAVDVVGSGSSYTSAAEIALLVRECLRIPATAFQTHQYLHGPMEAVGPGTCVIVIGDGRERLIPSALSNTNARFIVIGRAAAEGLPDFDIGARDGWARVAAEVVAGQRLMAAAAKHLPFEIEEFLHSQSDTKV